MEFGWHKTFQIGYGLVLATNLPSPQLVIAAVTLLRTSCQLPLDHYIVSSKADENGVGASMDPRPFLCTQNVPWKLLCLSPPALGL